MDWRNIKGKKINQQYQQRHKIDFNLVNKRILIVVKQELQDILNQQNQIKKNNKIYNWMYH